MRGEHPRAPRADPAPGQHQHNRQPHRHPAAPATSARPSGLGGRLRIRLTCPARLIRLISLIAPLTGALATGNRLAHGPAPGGAGFTDRQARCADWNCGEFGSMPVPRRSIPPLLLGSGMFGTPCERMHRVNFND